MVFEIDPDSKSLVARFSKDGGLKESARLCIALILEYALHGLTCVFGTRLDFAKPPLVC